MNKQVESQIKKIYNLIFKKVFTAQRVSSLIKGNNTDIVSYVSLLESSDQYNKFATKFAEELGKKGLNTKRGIWRKYFHAAKKSHYVGLPNTWQEFEKDILNSTIEQNFKMIKSIPQEVLKLTQKEYVSTLISQVVEGKLPRGSFEKQLKEHGAKNARVIARTETSKLQAAISEQRSKRLGSVAYIWRASNDKRTRKSHREMDGVIVFWRQESEKPYLDKMYGNAGEFPNCRCDSDAIFDKSDLTESKYKVYDYRIKKVISMPRNEVLEAIEKGSL